MAGYEDGSVTCTKLHIKHQSSFTKLWDMQNVHRGRVNCMLVCKTRLNSHELLLTGGDDGILRVWNYCTQQFMAQYPLMIGKVLHLISDFEHPEFVHVLGDAQQLITFSLKRESIVIRRILQKSEQKYGHMTNVIQSTIGEYPLLTSTSNGFVLLWDPELKHMIDIIDINIYLHERNHSLHLSTLRLSHSAKFLCCGSMDGKIIVLHESNRILISERTCHSNMITDIAWTPDDKQIVSSSFVLLHSLYVLLNA